MSATLVRDWRQLLFFDALVLFLLALVCLPFGFGSLEDYDLGWHLAGGLWALDHHALPGRDFLGAAGASWAAYSWLPEIIFARIFLIGGFTALQILQFVLVWTSAAVLYLQAAKGGTHLQIRSRTALVVFAALPLLAPFWQLRPQLLSIICFTLLISWVARAKLTFPRAAVLEVLWCNVHVFWAMVAPIYLVANIRRSCVLTLLATLLLTSAFVLSPLGYENIVVLKSYLFNHRAAYSLIREFFPLGPDLGFIFYYAIAAGGALIAVLRRSRREGVQSVDLLSLFFLCMALYQRKYLAYFAVCAVFSFTSRLVSKPERERSESLRLSMTACGLFLLLVILSFRFWDKPPALSNRTRDLLDAAADLQKSAAGAQAVVLNDFDDGGWLGLGLYLSRPAGSDESPLKTSIDGRTLVMGPERLLEYVSVTRGSEDICGSWNAEYAILSPESPLFANFQRSCLTEWTALGMHGDWKIFQRQALNKE